MLANKYKYILVAVMILGLSITIITLYYVGRNNGDELVSGILHDLPQWKDGEYSTVRELKFRRYIVPYWRMIVTHHKRGEQLAFYWHYKPWGKWGVESYTHN
jgi:hypothetical protein